MKIPFGIAQIGKAFRNEIVARQFIFRMREFEQMEMQFFVKPGTELEWFDLWRETRIKWHRALGFGDDNYRFHVHEKLAHYANAAVDVEYVITSYSIHYTKLYEPKQPAGTYGQHQLKSPQHMAHTTHLIRGRNIESSYQNISDAATNQNRYESEYLQLP